jgi:ribosomal protein S18 acetylase RimI-like enzyme
MEIRRATPSDYDAMWTIIRPILQEEATYVFYARTKKEDMFSYWFGEGRHTFVASSGESIAGLFMLKDNQPDLGNHIANGSYMVAKEFQGQGVGRLLGRQSCIEAKKMGYEAMQFNIVVKSNEGAVKLWKDLGFAIVGEVPDAFRHRQLGLVNAYVMYKKL